MQGKIYSLKNEGNIKKERTVSLFLDNTVDSLVKSTIINYIQPNTKAKETAQKINGYAGSLGLT